MRLQIIALTLVVLSLMIAFSARAIAEHPCPHHTATVQALRKCVEHAADVGHIDNAGVAQSLFAKLDAAQAALVREQVFVAINKLEAFIQEIEVQAGKHIEATHAAHMVAHAESVIQALNE